MAKRRRRARAPSPPKPASEDAVARARKYGVDIGQLQESLRLTPAERLARLDENAAAMRELRGAATRSRDGLT